ncbi:MAG: hypothetical protein ACOC97_00805 [Myxococcota bacterium]
MERRGVWWLGFVLMTGAGCSAGPKAAQEGTEPTETSSRPVSEERAEAPPRAPAVHAEGEAPGEAAEPSPEAKPDPTSPRAGEGGGAERSRGAPEERTDGRDGRGRAGGSARAPAAETGKGEAGEEEEDEPKGTKALLRSLQGDRSSEGSAFGALGGGAHPSEGGGLQLGSSRGALGLRQPEAEADHARHLLCSMRGVEVRGDVTAEQVLREVGLSLSKALQRCMRPLENHPGTLKATLFPPPRPGAPIRVSTHSGDYAAPGRRCIERRLRDFLSELPSGAAAIQVTYRCRYEQPE